MKELNLSNVAVIGGGRWGVVICSVLERVLPENVQSGSFLAASPRRAFPDACAGFSMLARYLIRIEPELRLSPRRRMTTLKRRYDVSRRAGMCWSRSHSRSS
jgi:hypothetical protein